MGMIEAIRAGLEENTCIAWQRFGSGLLPNPPYGTIKPESISGGRGIRVIIHDVQSNQEALEGYLRLAITYLQNRKIDYVDAQGNTVSNIIGEMVSYTDVGVVSDDSTISMEALFKVPTHYF